VFDLRSPFSGIFSNEFGDSKLKHIRMTSGYELFIVVSLPVINKNYGNKLNLIIEKD